MTTVPEVTTCERENGFLLIEVFSKLFNTQNYGHQGSILGGLFYFHLSVDIPDKISKILITEHSSSLLPPKSKTHRTRCPTVPPGCGAFFLGKLFNGLFCFNWRHSGKINIRQLLCWLNVFQTCEVGDIFDLRYKSYCKLPAFLYP